MMDDSIGIDISKDTLDACRLRDGQHRQFANRPAGFRALTAWIGADLPARVVYEPTGPYHGAFERSCAGHLPLVRVNPLQARRFAEARGSRAKTDRVDARMLAEMGAALRLEPDRPGAEDQPVLKELQAARRSLVSDRLRLANQLRHQSHPLTVKLSRARLRQADRQIAELDRALRQQIDTCATRARHRRILESIRGLGATTAAAILVDCPEIGRLDRKALASMAGLAPFARQSGQWSRAAHIRGGRGHLRRALYMPALTAIKWNPDLRRTYETMRARGKPAKVALVAIMRKLLELANALVRDNREWTPERP